MAAVLELDEMLMTIEDWELTPDDGNRYEVIEGEMYMASAPDIVHQIITTKTLFQFSLYLERNPIGLIVPTPGVIFSRYNGVIPDLVYLSNENRSRLIKEGKIRGAPDLLIEILSPGKTNTNRDRITKKKLYGKFGVKEYWILDPKTRSVEIYCLTDKGMKLFKICADEDEITTPLLPDFVCKASNLF
jgi:Uma2 family endonuclease